jgi:nucleotide-binding universal stress UspA family protein
MPHDSTSPAHEPDAVFDVVLVGIDDTPESLVAAAQAGVLRTPGSTLVLVAVAESYLAAHAGLAARHARTKVTESVSDDLARARRLVDADEAVLAEGRLVPLLRAEGEKREASLLVVGSRPHGRLRARTLGGHDAEALADLRRSVLIARPGWGPRRPDCIVLSADASFDTAPAGQVARRLAERLGCDLVFAVGLEDDPELDGIAGATRDVVLDPGSRADAAAHAVTAHSLLVVGAELGSEVVRQIVYGVPCSVLVVQHAAGAASAA